MSEQPRQLLARQSAQGLRPVFGAGAGEAIRRFGILTRLIQRAGLPLLFAEPQSPAGTLEWVTEHTGPVVAYPHLPAADQLRAIRVVSLLVNALYAFANSLPDKEATRNLLDACLQVPSLHSLLVVGRTPVVINWGFLSDDFNPPSGLIHRLIHQLPTPRLYVEGSVEIARGGGCLPNLPILWKQTNHQRSALTDADGQFLVEIEVREPLNLVIEVIAPNFDPLRVTPTLQRPLTELAWDDALTVPVSIILQPVPLPIASVRLQCRDSLTDQLLTGTLVRWQVGSVCTENQIDESGEVQFECIPPNVSDPIVVYITHPDYADERLEVLPEPGQLLEKAVRLTALATGGMKGHRGMLNVNLSWQTQDDLDLLVTDPAGQTISFSNLTAKIGECVGELDLDANAEGSILTDQPQENIYWERASPGSYAIEVMLYQKRSAYEEIPCTVTVSNRNDRSDFYQTLTQVQTRYFIAHINFTDK